MTQSPATYSECKQWQHYLQSQSLKQLMLDLYGIEVLDFDFSFESEYNDEGGSYDILVDFRVLIDNDWVDIRSILENRYPDEDEDFINDTMSDLMYDLEVGPYFVYTDKVNFELVTIRK